MGATEWLGESISGEISGAELKDPRRTRRLGDIAERLANDPAASFPDAFATSAELEGFYRFVRNDAFDWTDVLRPHVQRTLARAAELGECLAIHDTTEFAFSGQREGLGRTSSKAQGFLAHLTLLVGADQARTPLGVVAAELYARTGRKGRRLVRERRDDSSSEGLRWLRGAEAVESTRDRRFSCIHVADREGDTFHFLAGMLDLGARFVVRVSQNRRVVDEDGELTRLQQQVEALQPRSVFEIAITARGKRLNPTMAKSHPSRSERTARVALAATKVTVAVPMGRHDAPDIELNLVRVWEVDPPSDQPPVDWMLWTTEPVRTVAQMRKVVDWYRSRWVIEEYFKALKTGCQFEKRQLESFQTLTTALALFAPVAWKLLLMRSIAHSDPARAATAVLTPIQVKYLEKKYRQKLRTAREALLATARLGGHLKQNGEPGWQTLGRGYEKLVAGEAFLEVMGSIPTREHR